MNLTWRPNVNKYLQHAVRGTSSSQSSLYRSVYTDVWCTIQENEQFLANLESYAAGNEIYTIIFGTHCFIKRLEIESA